MKIKINEDVFFIKRIIKNGMKYSKEFIESAFINSRADTLIQDREGNLLLCNKTKVYDLDTSDNVWRAVDRTPTSEEMDMESETIREDNGQ